MISQKRFFELILDLAKSLVPREGLADEQLDKLCELTISGCRCNMCKHNEANAHTDKRGHEIRWSRYHFWDDDIIAGSPDCDTLLEATLDIFHEIIHQLFPDYDEQEVRQKAVEFLERNVLLEEAKKMSQSPDDLLKAGYRLKSPKPKH
ncbi:MAG: hypothetical protein ABSF44_10485 [Candidatus Bathyarchaeia archaeon]|jgi:hypothetical protein